jgi:hypothetical protein
MLSHLIKSNLSLFLEKALKILATMINAHTSLSAAADHEPGTLRDLRGRFIQERLKANQK